MAVSARMCPSANGTWPKHPKFFEESDRYLIDPRLERTLESVYRRAARIGGIVMALPVHLVQSVPTSLEKRLPFFTPLGEWRRLSHNET